MTCLGLTILEKTGRCSAVSCWRKNRPVLITQIYHEEVTWSRHSGIHARALRSCPGGRPRPWRKGPPRNTDGPCTLSPWRTASPQWTQALPQWGERGPPQRGGYVPHARLCEAARGQCERAGGHEPELRHGLQDPPFRALCGQPADGPLLRMLCDSELKLKSHHRGLHSMQPACEWLGCARFLQG